MKKCDNIIRSYYRLKPFINKTPLELNERLSKKYNANIFFKREDLQKTRSFKIRGSLNKIIKATNKGNLNKNIVCASAGNHAQGVAYACNLLGLKSDIFVPTITSPQKISRIKNYGNKEMNLIKTGNDFDECLNEAQKFSEEKKHLFIHPYDDLDIIEGQGTLAYEIEQDLNADIIITCIGGGGLVSGLLEFSNNYKIIGSEPKGAHSMYKAIENNNPIKIKDLDTFVDGASVRKVGKTTFEIAKKMDISDIKVIENGLLCHEMIELYQEDGIIT